MEEAAAGEEIAVELMENTRAASGDMDADFWGPFPGAAPSGIFCNQRSAICRSEQPGTEARAFARFVLFVALKQQG